MTSVTDKGYSFELNREECRISKGGEVFALGKRVNQLYQLLFQVENSEKNESRVYLSTYQNKKEKLKVWHERLSHQNVAQVRSILNQLKISFIDDRDFFCEDCMLGKLHVLPFKLSNSRADQPGKIIHADVCGPMEEESLGGAYYFLMLKDDYSHYRTIYFLKRKSEAKQKIVEFLVLAETQTGNRVKILRTDNGLEEVNKEVESYLASKGIIHQKSCPYTPQQNGRIERENRTIVEAARTILHSKNLEKKLWAEAINTVNFVINRSGSSSVKNKTPYELWFEETPDIRFFQIFGSEAFVHQPKILRKKLDPCGKKGVFVGYAEESKGFRIYMRNEGRVIISRNVIFKPESKEESEEFTNIREDRTEYIEELEPTMNEFLNEVEEIENEVEETENEVENIDINNEETGANQQNVNEQIVETEDEEEDQNEATNRYNLRNRSCLRQPRKLEVYDMDSSYEEEDCETALICSSILDDNLSYQEAVTGPNSKHWKEAIKEEFKALEANQTWMIVRKPIRKTIIDTKWVFKMKRNEKGEPSVFKARLVARGFQQKEIFDFSETYAPVAKLTTLRVLLSLANQYDYKVHQMDVKSAFLNGEVGEEIFVYPPEGMELPENQVLKLVKSLYGLKKSPHYWNKKFNAFMEDSGFERSKADFCLYIKTEKHARIYVLLYVDDLIICGNGRVEDFKGRLQNHFQMNDLGPVSNYLGLHIKQEKESIVIHQISYLKRILKLYGMENCNPVSTPLIPGIMFPKNPSPDKEMEHKCRKLIGYVMYAMLGSRPDLCAAISILSRYQNRASLELFGALKRVLRYIKGTLHLKLIYLKSNTNNRIIQGYVDSDYAGDEDRKSTTGYLIKVLDNTVSWATKKQSTTALSSCEAEYVALTAGINEACWIKYVLRDLRVGRTERILIFEDNQSAIKVSQTPANTKRLKHIDVKYHYIKQLVEEGTIELKHISSKNQIADILTKGVPRHQFEKLRSELGLK